MIPEPTVRWYDKDFNHLFTTEGFPAACTIIRPDGSQFSGRVEYSVTSPYFWPHKVEAPQDGLERSFWGYWGDLID